MGERLSNDRRAVGLGSSQLCLRGASNRGERSMCVSVRWMGAASVRGGGGGGGVESIDGGRVAKARCEGVQI